jgi:hypothetical protein
MGGKRGQSLAMFHATGSSVFVMTVQQIRWQSKDKNSGSCTPDLDRPQNHENNITLDVISDRVPGPLNVFAGIESSSSSLVAPPYRGEEV